MQNMKQKHAFCVPIIKTTKSEVLKTIKTYRRNYTYFEIWLDYVEDLDLDFVNHLETMLQDKLILLFRRQKLEKPKMNKLLKEKILQNLHNSDSFVDFDIKSQAQDVEFVKKEKIQLKLLLSYHNYTETPLDLFLKKTLTKMERFKPEIYKISCFCKSDQDATRLLKILADLKTDNKKCIILGMGSHGVYTRICGMLMGNEFSFAPMTQKEASAPGQLTQKELKGVLKALERNN